MITIVDYGLGNVQAIANIYKRLNIPVTRAATAHELDGTQKMILPGVGAFDWAMSRLEASGMRGRLDELVLEERRPVLGICVGMQMLGYGSDEGELDGLGWIEGNVRRFDEASFTGATHLPHMGWNDVKPVPATLLFAGLEQDARFYFLHSYYFAPRNEADMLAVTDYGGTFACSVARDNVYGVQFHPEKSHQWGVRLLKNFAEM